MMRLAQDSDAELISAWTDALEVHRVPRRRRARASDRRTVARALAPELTSMGWTPRTVDPALDNRRAITAWRTAGFVATEIGVDGGRPTQVMAFSPTIG